VPCEPAQPADRIKRERGARCAESRAGYVPIPVAAPVLAATNA
jgi:hypothetical protein